MVKQNPQQHFPSYEALSYTSTISPDHLRSLAVSTAQSVDDTTEPLQYNPDNELDKQTPSLSLDQDISSALALCPASCNKKDSLSSLGSVLSYVDNYLDAPIIQRVITPSDYHPYTVLAGAQSADKRLGPLPRSQSRLPPQNNPDNTSAADERLASPDPSSSVAYALEQPAKPTGNIQPSLRSKFPRRFTSHRRPRQARAKSLNHLALVPQVEGQ